MKKYEWLFAMMKLNWQNMISHKGMFLSMMLSMCIQNLIYFSMWVIIFSKVQSLHGWGLPEVAFLYAAGALGYGVFFTIFGGLNQLGQMIQDGELDVHLGRPRSPLLMALMQRMRADSLGDVLTGIIMLALFVHPPVESWGMIALLTLSAGIVFASFRLISHAWAFWGLSGEASENMFMAFIITATNPQKGFGPVMKFVLLTVFPAGYVGLLPVEILQHFRWDYLVLQLFGTMAIFIFSLWLFDCGLKRYASGNKFLVLR